MTFFPLEIGDGMGFLKYLSPYVATLQHLLGVERDGRFGPKTGRALGRSALTYRDWVSLPHRKMMGAELRRMITHLQGFRGNLATLLRWEGVHGKPYWPGGHSGVTLDPGIDLGHSSFSENRLRNVIKEMRLRLSPEQLESVFLAKGLRGEAARDFLANDLHLNAIEITTDQAWRALPVVAAPYWKAATHRWPSILMMDTPGVVHDVVLSLVFNRGPGNPKLAVLDEALQLGNWNALAGEIEGMQSDHLLPGIPTRRAEEAGLILLHQGRLV